MTLRGNVEPFRGSAAEWDGFVRTQPGWTHFHLHGWRDVMARVFGHETPYLCLRAEKGPLRAVLPLVWVRSRLFGRFLVSMPFVNYGGVLGDAEAAKALGARAAELADAGRGVLEVRSRGPMESGWEVSLRKVTVTRSLAGGPGAVWDSLKAKVRSQVRRPQKEGAGVRFGHETAGDFYRVFARNMRDLGTPVLPRAFFDTIAEVFGDSVWFGCAHLAGRPVAAGCGFRWGGEFEMTWASSLSEFNPVAPNMLLYWSFMERCAAEGIGMFNFGRCTPGGGTHRFKLQWGGADEQLYWYRYPGNANPPRPEDWKYGLARHAWRRLPVSLANALGPSIVRGIP